MKEHILEWDGISLPVIEADAAVIGTGCAGYNGADTLYRLGMKNIVIISEGREMGTSRNTGSDKQTYYKLSLSSNRMDSVGELAKTLFAGGGVDGDIALCEAAGSVRGFMKLVELGVPFPTNRYGEYVGYKTDHDPYERATSCGPLTSRKMTEALERAVFSKGIPVLDKMQVISLLTDDQGIHGVICLNKKKLDTKNFGLTVVKANYVLIATGGPAIVYANSVYPASQTGMTGTALEAGAAGNNLQEWQYGLSSIKFRWNVSGTYQQVLPRYVSVDAQGNEREFLGDYLGDPQKVLELTFLKGYQWPFDVRKIPGSSLIDLMVHHEIFQKGNRVFLDFRKNPKELSSDFSVLPSEVYEYLNRSGALLNTPIERLEQMNPKAAQLYQDHGIDLSREMLEISVCAQHCNGGLKVDCHWQTTIPGLYAAGEAAGTFGVYRPGGSALNSTQVGSFRAAEHMVYEAKKPVLPWEEFESLAKKQAGDMSRRMKEIKQGTSTVAAQRRFYQKQMSGLAGHLRQWDQLEELEETIQKERFQFWSSAVVSSREEIPGLWKNWDMLLCQQAVLSAMRVLMPGAKSRGSGLMVSQLGSPLEGAKLPIRYFPEEKGWEDSCVETRVQNGIPFSAIRKVRPIPQENNWFETVWKEYDAVHKENGM
ncbi:MAG: FAD-binding protein [Massiliimalia sp.]|jgi:succinate dehydrogenase/fumarate reductase flavoprotein subunit